MTEAEMKEQLQGLQDALEIALAQRNDAQNQQLQLGAQLKAAGRKLAELEAKLKAKDDEPELPLSNGYDQAEVRSS